MKTILLRKDPQSIQSEGFDWEGWLNEKYGSPLVTLYSSSWAVTPALAGSPAVGLVLSGDGIVTGGLRTVVTLSDGVDGTVYTVTNHVVLTNGMADDRSFLVRVEDR